MENTQHSDFHQEVRSKVMLLLSGFKFEPLLNFFLMLYYQKECCYQISLLLAIFFCYLVKELSEQDNFG